MTISFRIATVAAIICTSSLVAAATPGLAITPDKPAIITPTILEEIRNVRDASANPERPTIASLPTQQTSEAESTTETGQTFTSLASAVAAQSMPEQMDEDLRCLASAIYYESKGEPLSGQLGVAKVILNRTKSGRFPRSVCSVVTQRGQFSFVRGGKIPNPGLSVPAYRTAVAVAKVALRDHWESPVPGALYFHASSVSPGWSKQRIAAIGHHVFYR